MASCPHCFNTISREYPQLGGNYEVIHHTQLLASLVADGKIRPAGEVKEKITYHDPCFLGRHNKVFTPPREIIDAVPGTTAEEMHRCKNRGFCCGAGGARMWMEERIGKRINTERIDEALALNPDTISTACPYCMVMLGDAVAAKKSSGEAKETLEVIDVAQLLVRSATPVRAAVADDGSAPVGDDTAGAATGQDGTGARTADLAVSRRDPGRLAERPVAARAGVQGRLLGVGAVILVRRSRGARPRYGQPGSGMLPAGQPPGRRRITSSTTRWLRRSFTTTRTSLAQQAARRISRAASRSAATIPAPAPQRHPLAEFRGTV